jgi:hypothetical protein
MVRKHGSSHATNRTCSCSCCGVRLASIRSGARAGDPSSASTSSARCKPLPPGLDRGGPGCAPPLPPVLPPRLVLLLLSVAAPPPLQPELPPASGRPNSAAPSCHTTSKGVRRHAPCVVLPSRNWGRAAASGNWRASSWSYTARTPFWRRMTTESGERRGATDATAAAVWLACFGEGVGRGGGFEAGWMAGLSCKLPCPNSYLGCYEEVLDRLIARPCAPGLCRDRLCCTGCGRVAAADDAARALKLRGRLGPEQQRHWPACLAYVVCKQASYRSGAQNVKVHCWRGEAAAGEGQRSLGCRV